MFNSYINQLSSDLLGQTSKLIESYTKNLCIYTRSKMNDFISTQNQTILSNCYMDRLSSDLLGQICLFIDNDKVYNEFCFISKIWYNLLNGNDSYFSSKVAFCNYKQQSSFMKHYKNLNYINDLLYANKNDSYNELWSFNANFMHIITLELENLSISDCFDKDLPGTIKNLKISDCTFNFADHADAKILYKMPMQLRKLSFIRNDIISLSKFEPCLYLEELILVLNDNDLILDNLPFINIKTLRAFKIVSKNKTAYNNGDDMTSQMLIQLSDTINRLEWEVYNNGFIGGFRFPSSLMELSLSYDLKSFSCSNLFKRFEHCSMIHRLILNDFNSSYFHDDINDHQRSNTNNISFYEFEFEDSAKSIISISEINFCLIPNTIKHATINSTCTENFGIKLFNTLEILDLNAKNIIISPRFIKFIKNMKINRLSDNHITDHA